MVIEPLLEDILKREAKRENKMELKNQVVSLDLAKKLKELGFSQESLYYHIYWDWNLYGLVSKEHIDSKSEGGKIEFGMNRYSAYTVAELGEMLPELCLSGKANAGYNCWWVEDMCIREIKHYNTFQTDTEADARAKCLIYLKGK